MMRKILFICVHNSGRSQMAEAFFNNLANGKTQAFSAGTSPAHELNAHVVKVMKEVGIDISEQKPKLLTLEMMRGAERVISMGCGVEKACPARFAPSENWEIEDPEEKTIEEIRDIRDTIKERIESLIKTL